MADSVGCVKIKVVANAESFGSPGVSCTDAIVVVAVMLQATVTANGVLYLSVWTQLVVPIEPVPIVNADVAAVPTFTAVTTANSVVVDAVVLFGPVTVVVRDTPLTVTPLIEIVDVLILPVLVIVMVRWMPAPTTAP